MKSKGKRLSDSVVSDGRHKSILMGVIVLLAMLGVILSVGWVTSAAGSDSDQEYDFWAVQTGEEVLVNINSHTEEKAAEIAGLGYHVTESFVGDDLICKTAGEYQAADTPLKYADTNKGFLSSYLIDNDLIDIQARAATADAETYNVICLRLAIAGDGGEGSPLPDGILGYRFSEPLKLEILTTDLFTYGEAGTPYLVGSSLELNEGGIDFTVGVPNSSMAPISVRYSLNEEGVKLCNMEVDYYPNGDIPVLRQTSGWLPAPDAPADDDSPAVYADFNVPSETGISFSDYSSLCVMFVYSDDYNSKGYWYGVYGPVDLPEATVSSSDDTQTETSTVPNPTPPPPQGGTGLPPPIPEDAIIQQGN